jgi:hypothetical protein
MKKIISSLLIFFPALIWSQPGGSNLDTTKSNALTELVWANKEFRVGDTVVNLNALNNGIKSYQISEESKKVITNNGLAINDGAVASDNEWYENTVKLKVRNNDIRLINITSDKIEMATGFRKDGKIYVVVTVSMILFFTVIFYLVYLERKTKRLEKDLKGK